MRGGGGDGKDKEKYDRRSCADEAVLVWGKGMVVGERGGTALCVSHARAVAFILSPLGGRYCGRRAACAQAYLGEEEVGWGWGGGDRF